MGIRLATHPELFGSAARLVTQTARCCALHPESRELNSITLGDDFCVRGVMSAPDAVEHSKMRGTHAANSGNEITPGRS